MHALPDLQKTGSCRCNDTRRCRHLLIASSNAANSCEQARLHLPQGAGQATPPTGCWPDGMSDGRMEQHRQGLLRGTCNVTFFAQGSLTLHPSLSFTLLRIWSSTFLPFPCLALHPPLPSATLSAGSPRPVSASRGALRASRWASSCQASEYVPLACTVFSSISTMLWIECRHPITFRCHGVELLCCATCT